MLPLIRQRPRQRARNASLSQQAPIVRSGLFFASLMMIPPDFASLPGTQAPSYPVLPPPKRYGRYDRCPVDEWPCHGCRDAGSLLSRFQRDETGVRERRLWPGGTDRLRSATAFTRAHRHKACSRQFLMSLTGEEAGSDRSTPGAIGRTGEDWQAKKIPRLASTAHSGRN